MNSDNFGGHPRPEALDADAVCAQCSTVNAEGTLLCKVCGNNLRDQRMIRLAADQAMDLEQSGRRRRSWISGIMFLLAIGLIVSTLMNQDMIVEWLVSSGETAQANTEALWSGDYDSYFSELLAELSARQVTEESARAALALEAPASELLDGTYALFVDDVFAGSAQVSVYEDIIYFVAVLDSGDEVRGIAGAQGNYYASLPESAAVRDRGRIGEVRGVAMPRGNGVLECIGDANNEQVNFVAYQLPET